jgi:hypothetical protein
MGLFYDGLYLPHKELRQLVDQLIHLIINFQFLPLEQQLQKLVILLIKLTQGLKRPSPYTL